MVGNDNPFLMVSNFSGKWPGLVGLLNTGACLAAEGRKTSRLWTDAADWSADSDFLERLEAWCDRGHLAYDETAIRTAPAVSGAAAKRAAAVFAAMRKRRPIALMLGDTSMGMINGYFGARLLHRLGFAEHKVDQAWILDRGSPCPTTGGSTTRFKFVQDKGHPLPLGRGRRRRLHPRATREQLRGYLAVLDLLGGVPGRLPRLAVSARPDSSLSPPSDFAEGLLNSDLPARRQRPCHHHFAPRPTRATCCRWS